MSVRCLTKKLSRLEGIAARRDPSSGNLLTELAQEPEQILVRAGLPPDPWQMQLLRADVPRRLLCCSRQSGKSTVAAALALSAALLHPRSPVLLLSPSLRQSSELFRKVLDLFNALERPIGVTAESALRIEFSNGSRVVALPGDEKNVRCFSGVAMLIIDEAARVSDALYCSVRPMLAVSRGRLVALSTPFGKRGWFHEEWHGPGDWERVRITAPNAHASRRSSWPRNGGRWVSDGLLRSFCVRSRRPSTPSSRRPTSKRRSRNDVEPLFFERA